MTRKIVTRLLLVLVLVGATVMTSACGGPTSSAVDSETEIGTSQPDAGIPDMSEPFLEACTATLGDSVGLVRVTVQDGPDIAEGREGNTIRGDVELTSALEDERLAYGLLARLHRLRPEYPVCVLTISFPKPDGSGSMYTYDWNTVDDSQTVSWGVLSGQSIMVMEFRTTHPAWDATGDGDLGVTVRNASAELVDGIAEGAVEVPKHVGF